MHFRPVNSIKSLAGEPKLGSRVLPYLKIWGFPPFSPQLIDSHSDHSRFILKYDQRPAKLWHKIERHDKSTLNLESPRFWIEAIFHGVCRQIPMVDDFHRINSVSQNKTLSKKAHKISSNVHCSWEFLGFLEAARKTKTKTTQRKLENATLTRDLIWLWDDIGRSFGIKPFYHVIMKRIFLRGDLYVFSSWLLLLNRD